VTRRVVMSKSSRTVCSHFGHGFKVSFQSGQSFCSYNSLIKEFPRFVSRSRSLSQSPRPALAMFCVWVLMVGVGPSRVGPFVILCIKESFCDFVY